MAVTFLAASLMLAQAAAIAAPTTPAVDRVDVGYEALVQGRPHEAIARIKANDGRAASDPAALINLGSAFARLGQNDKAEASFKAAIASEDRQDLELADGSWMDSRRAARIALKRLDSGQTLALR
jgi:Tfp pilus assembly protein PilF